MVPELTKGLQFGELLTNTFPGFFSAITLFMLIDIWSPLNLTSWAIRDVSNLIGFIGFVVLFGTILGVIIDGIHHMVIEDIIFNNFLELKKIKERFKALYPKNNPGYSYSYFYKIVGDKFTENHEFFLNSQYRYSEFHANTFISLIPLSVIAPFYLYNVLQLPCISSIFFGLVSLVIAYCCLKDSYLTLKNYNLTLFSFICGYLDYGYYVDLSVSAEYKVPIDEKVQLQARIVDKKSICVPKEGIEIVIETNFGNFYNDSSKIIIKTDQEGKARANLTSAKSVTAILTASSYKCIPGIASVEFTTVSKR